MKADRIFRIVIGAVLILLVPLVAMLVSDEVKWDWFDFAVIGTLLIGTGFLYELITARVNERYRAAVAVVLVAALLLVWAELAVGVFGSPVAGS